MASARNLRLAQVAQLHPARGAQPDRLRLANAAHLFATQHGPLSSPPESQGGRVRPEVSSGP
eukprot:997443-Prymnesium_polylepis.1